MCIEPDPKYHAQLREKRTCEVVPMCISEKTEKRHFTFQGVGGHLLTNGKEVSCMALHDMLPLGKEELICGH